MKIKKKKANIKLGILGGSLIQFAEPGNYLGYSGEQQAAC